MKKIFIYAAALTALASALVSCSKEEPENPNPPVDPINHFEAGQSVTLTGFTAQTKVSSGIEGGNLVFRWEENDQIKVTVNGSSSTFTLTSVDKDGKGTFTGKMPATGETYTAQFPVETPDITSQDYYEGALPHNMMLFTTPESQISADFSMKNENSFLLLNFNSKESQSVGKIEFTALATGNPDPIYTLNCKTTEHPNGVQLSEADTQFFMIAPTGTYKAKVEVFDENNAIICSFQSKNEMAFTAGQAFSMPSKEVVKPTLGIKFQRNGVDVTAETTTMAPATAYTIPDLTNIGTGDVVKYESSDPTKASFANENDPTITINAITDTDTPITIKATRAESASYKAAEATYQLTITRQPQEIKLMRDDKEIDLTEGESITWDQASSFTLPVAKDVTGTDPHSDVTFTSSDETVAKYVDSKFTILKVGNTTITATAAQTAVYESTSVSYKLSIGLAEQTITLWRGETPMTSTETVSMADKATYTVPEVHGAQTAVKFKSDNTEVATFNEAGTKITLLKAGKANITAQAVADDKYKASNEVSYELTVTQPVTGIDLKSSTTLYLGKTGEVIAGTKETLSPTIKPDDATDKTVTWSTSNGNVVSVSDAGEITAKDLTNGTPVDITCTAKDGSGKSATCKVTVDPVVATAITLNTATTSIEAGGTYTLSVTSWNPTNTYDKTVTWSVTKAEPSGCVTVDANGKVTANAVGTATVVCTANSDTNVTAPCDVTVVPKQIKSFDLGLDISPLMIYENGKLTVKDVSPSDATYQSQENKDFTWSSDKPSIVAVDDKGNLTGAGVGEATITCTAKDGGKASKTFKVTVVGYYQKLKDAEAYNGQYIITNTGNNKAFKGIVDGDYFKTSGNTVTVVAKDTSILSQPVTIIKDYNKDGDWAYCPAILSVASSSSSTYYIKFNKAGRYLSVAYQKYTFCQFSSNYYGDNLIEKHADYQFEISRKPVAHDRKYITFDGTNFSGTKTESQVSIWKYVGVNTSKDAQDPKFGTASYDWSLGTSKIGTSTVTIGGTYTPQTVTNYKTTPIYSSSNPEVATVNSSTGAVTLVAPGSTTITADCPENEDYWAGSASYTISIAKTVQTAKFANASVTWSLTNSLKINGTYDGQQFAPASTTVKYSSNNDNVAIVNSSNGKITIKGTGTVTITAEAEETDDFTGANGTYTLEIEKSNQPLSFGSDTVEWPLSNSRKVGSTYEGQTVSGAVSTVEYTTTSDNISVNSSTGAITIINTGTTGSISAVIKAKAGSTQEYNETTKEYTLKIYKSNQPLSFGSDTVEWPLSNSRKVGSTYEGQTVSGAVSTVEYTTTSNSISVNSSTGAITIINTGTTGSISAVIKAKAGSTPEYKETTKEYTLKIYKSNQPLSFAEEYISWDIDDYQKGKTYDGQTVTGAYTTVTYSSNNTKVAQVNQNNGKITVKGTGTARITAKAESTNEYYEATAYYDLNIYDGCLAPGTKITMADGSLKNVEQIISGELIRTFDHETGSISSSAVCITYKTQWRVPQIVLNFASGSSTSIAYSHSLLAYSTRKYTDISRKNVKSFIGESFYRVEDGTWDCLIGYAIEEFVYGYTIVTRNHLDCIADGLLSCTDELDYILNIYELDEKLKADPKQLAADIAKYGLTDIARDYPQYAQYKDLIEAIGGKYIKIAVGKGLATEEEILDRIENYIKK